MDKEINYKERRSAKIRKWMRALIIIGLLIFAYFFVRKWLLPKATFSEFTIATIERGDIKNTFTASGVVVPAFEREINAPVKTEIKKLITPKGSLVKNNELIMELDQEFTKLEYEKLEDELGLKRNNIDKLKLTFDKDLKDLDYQDQIKALELSELDAQIKDQERLLIIGGGTPEDLEKVQLRRKVAGIEKKMLENNLAYAKSVNLTDKANLELEYKIQQKRMQELRRKLAETSVRSPLNGVITWINENIGKTVLEGEPLVKIAVLDTYIVEASSSDRNSERIQVGLPAIVRINRTEILGTIASISPNVENNTVRFIVEIPNNKNEVLRPNMRTEVFIVTDEKKQVLRVRNGEAFKGASSQDIFVVRGDQAMKTPISRGLTNSDYVEIVESNLKVGDKIIISETKDYDHLNQFTLKVKL